MLLASKLPLPDECIDLILAYLVHDRITLHALILSSQKLFQRAVPVLYRSPFQLLHESPLSIAEREARISSLVALLLSSRSTEIIRGSAFIIGIPLSDNGGGDISVSGGMMARAQVTIDARTGNRNNLNEDGLNDKTQNCSDATISTSSAAPAAVAVPSIAIPAASAVPAASAAFVVPDDPASPISATTVDYLRFFTHQYEIDLWRSTADLRGRTTAEGTGPWIIDDQKPTKSLVKDLAMSLLQYWPEDIRIIGQPLEHIPLLLPSLERLRNLVRIEISGIPACGTRMVDLAPKIEPLLEFIRVHDAVHRTLREIKIKGKDDQSNKTINEAHKGLVRLVQAMRTPEVVDARHWREAILVLEQIPVESLKSLLLGWSNGSDTRAFPAAYMSRTSFVNEYLARCRVLEDLRMAVHDEEMFQWAVVERRKMAAAMTGKGRGLGGHSHNRATQNQPLSKISFRQRGNSASGGEAHHNESRRQGSLPPLRSIDLCGENSFLIPAFINAMDAFRDTLETLKGVSLATNLSLMGTSMVLPDTFEKLSDMFLHSTNSMAAVTSTPLSLSGSLTWSWPLTRLTTLDLEGEVAIAFNFESLEFCPNLLTLRLSLPPYLFSTSEDDRVLKEMTARMPLICRHARNLLDLELYEKWPVSDQLIGLMVRTMRRLTRLYIVRCLEYTVRGVQSLILGCARLERLSINKWLCALHPQKTQLQAALLMNTKVTLIEE
ncbi:hypothetical protein EMPS_02518 [Entomortierella parvispora]|uniref:Uncharacterized protein n=1 Tax=Entomortierella parvispora TaxID=205924 RepID=A0A9P3H4V8_9FUNG|nr:hypothetical protein EMPS_02518 [Entomortierella parvispora]